MFNGGWRISIVLMGQSEKVGRIIYSSKLKLLIKIVVTLVFIASIVQLVILSVRFGSGHWVTICSAGQGNDVNIAYGSVYFTDKGYCSSQDSPKITVWVKDPWSFNLNFLSSVLKNRNTPVAVPENTSTPTSTAIPTKTPIPQPAYSVTVPNQAILGENGFNFSAQVKNVSVKPYITDLGFYECLFTDSTNTNYKGKLGGANVHFDKALLPSGVTNAEFKNVGQAYLDIGASANYGTSYLTYKYRDANGDTITKTINGLKIVNCTAYISSEDKGAGDGWGQTPITIKFP